jgi:hypothetical protein
MTPTEADAADILATIALWQGLGLSAGHAWQALGGRGTCTSWAMVRGFMVAWQRNQRELSAPVRRAA